MSDPEIQRRRAWIAKYECDVSHDAIADELELAKEKLRLGIAITMEDFPGAAANIRQQAALWDKDAAWIAERESRLIELVESAYELTAGEEWRGGE